MTQALNEQVADGVFRTWLIDTFDQMANHMVNTDSPAGCSMSAVR